LFPVALILTCEHAGNRVPAGFRSLFKDHRAILHTHEAYDVGALPLARSLSRLLGAPLFFASETRLLIDQNRSLTNRNLFSRFSEHLPASVKQKLIGAVYRPYQERIVHRVRKCLSGRQRVLHCAIHTFTPVLRGQIRNADIGILYDPASSFERSVVQSLRKTLHDSLQNLRIRCNYPYRGTSDGLTRSLRRMFGMKRYAGIEIEINQKALRGSAAPLSRAFAAAAQNASAAR
jgi:predicted N-formylglutamate amidohydrolase